MTTPTTLLLLHRLAYVAGIADSVDHLRDTARGLHGEAGDRHRRSALGQAANKLDERIGRHAQRRRDLATPTHSPTACKERGDAVNAPRETEKDVRCPTCGATTWVQHPRLSDALRCANCAEWQPIRHHD